MPETRTFRQVLGAAVDDLAERGFVSAEQVETWLGRLRAAAERELGSEASITESMRAAMDLIFRRLVERGKVVERVPEVGRYTLAMVRPELRAELDRRILASADLIKLRRRESIETTLARFQGWATSIPNGGEGMIDKREVRAHVAKDLRTQRYERRRVAIDQGHKLAANVADIVATGNGAIAAEWNHVLQAGYDARPAHEARDGRVFLIRDSWAHRQGLVRPGRAGYVDQIERPGEFVFCFPGDLKVQFADGIEVAYRRWFSGELATVVTASGKTLRATPNHPVMTSLGWRPIGSLHAGDDVIEAAEDAFPRAEDQNDRIPSIHDVFQALSVFGVSKTIPLTAAAFHGDGAPDGYVDAVSSARRLNVHGQRPTFESFGQLGLAISDGEPAGVGHVRQALLAISGAARLRVRGLRQAAAAIMADAFHANGAGFRYSAEVYAGGLEALVDCEARHAEARRYGEDAFAVLERLHGRSGIEQESFLRRGALVGTDLDEPVVDGHSTGPDDGRDLVNRLPFRAHATKVVRVESNAWAGHVYNLQTRDGWYVGNGIITHNCRCWYRYVLSPRNLPDDLLTRKGQEWVRAGRERHGAVA